MDKGTVPPYSRTLINKYRRNDGNIQSPSDKCHSNTFYWQELTMGAKIRGQKNNEEQDICIISSISSQDTRYLLIISGKIQWRTLWTPS